MTLKQVKAWIHYNKRARDSRERPAYVRVAKWQTLMIKVIMAAGSNPASDKLPGVYVRAIRKAGKTILSLFYIVKQ